MSFGINHQIKKIKLIYAVLELHTEKRFNPYISTVSLIFSKINPQIIDGFLDFFDFHGNRLGEFLLILDDFIDKKLQFPYQIDRKYQRKAVICYQFQHIFNIQLIYFLSKPSFLQA